jgi:dCMP deaminase
MNDDTFVAELEKLRREHLSTHFSIDDCWYSCPKSPYGCYDDSVGTACNCGADEHNAILDRLIAVVRGSVPVTRPSWDDYFINIAGAVATRAECSRAQHGAVIVDQHHRIISTGYNGTPPGDPRSCLRGDCPRATSGVAHNSGGYENCIALHAEQNAIANATREMRGGTIYITGRPCPMCSKLILAAGLEACWPI